MGRRGPAPKPTALKIAQGNPGKRRLNDDEPIPPPGSIKPPKWMTAQGLAIWEQLAPVCEAMGTLTTADVVAFARHCENIALDLQAREFLTKFGSTFPVTDAKGQPRGVQEFPQAYQMRRLQQIITAGDDRFGLNPAARSRIRVERTGAGTPPAEAPGTGKPQDLRDRFFRGPLPFKSA